MSMQGFFQNHNGISGTLRFTVTSEGCKGTFLNEDLYGNVYMTSKGFVVEGEERKGMLPKEIHLWIKVSFKAVVLEV